MKRVISYIVFLVFCISSFTSCDGVDFNEIFSKNVQEILSYLNQIMYDQPESTSLKADESNERFKIVHMSDIHLFSKIEDKNEINIINLKEVINFSNLKESKINAIVATGDFVSNKNNSKKEDIKDFIRAFNYNFFNSSNHIPSFVCTGNHDSNMIAKDKKDYLSKSDIHETLFKNINYPYQQPANENYYYSDVVEPNGKIIRFIALDCTDQESFYYNSLNAACITQKQIDWFINVALKENMTKNHSVIILTHYPLQNYSKDGSTYMCAGYHLYDVNLIPSIVDAFQNKTIFCKTYQTTVSPQNTINVNADFRNTEGEFICYLGGHTHTYAHFDVINNKSSNKKQIMLLANTMSPFLQNNNFGHIDRDISNENGNSFSVYSIDTNKKNIYITYYGPIKQTSSKIEKISYK